MKQALGHTVTPDTISHPNRKALGHTVITAVPVAETIIQQLGGQSRLRVMVNAKDFVATDNGLMFRFSGCRKANKVRITLNSMDTYDVEFFKIKKFTFETAAKFEHIYNVDLKAVFEDETGLYLSI